MPKLFLNATLLIGGTILLLSLTACGDPLGAWGDVLPSAEEVNAWEDYYAELSQVQAAFDNGPTVAVRVVNNSAAAARVVLMSTAEPPPAPTDYLYGAGEASYSPIGATEVVLVSAGGTATGTVKCGDTIAISALAPLDATPFYAEGYFDGLGSYVDPGNIVLSGVGAAPDSEFSGDVIPTIRLVTPATDGLDCAANTLVITIQTAGTESVYDPTTGALLTGAAPGDGTITIE